MTTHAERVRSAEQVRLALWVLTALWFAGSVGMAMKVDVVVGLVMAVVVLAVGGALQLVILRAERRLD